jgi:hypothetical protein
LQINISIVKKNERIKKCTTGTASLAELDLPLEMRRLESRLALSGATVVVLDVFGRVVGRYDDDGGGVSCTRGLFDCI